MGKFQQYKHHDNIVWTNIELQGKYEEHCLCYSCKRFRPFTLNNCHIAQENYELCKKLHLVLPVYECPEFVEEKEEPLGIFSRNNVCGKCGSLSASYNYNSVTNEIKRICKECKNMWYELPLDTTQKEDK
jgi:hypothetical protein